MSDPKTQREWHKANIRNRQTAMERAVEDLRRATDDRDEALVAAHGDKKAGFLSYGELADAAGISKGRVIQVVQPRKAAANGR